MGERSKGKSFTLRSDATKSKQLFLVSYIR